MEKQKNLRKINHSSDAIRWFDYEFSSKRGERLASSMRRLIEEISTMDYTPDVTDEIAESLEKMADRLKPLPKRELRNGMNGGVSEKDVYNFLAHDPIQGKLNPLAPPLQMHAVDDRIEGTVTFGSAYEGPPGFAHGGYIAAVFDILLGGANAFSENPGFTGTLSIRYMAPTPLHQELKLTATLIKTQGRKTHAVGKMMYGDIVTAEATGIFISL